MSWAGKKHPLEVAIEWLAPIPLGLAVSWAGLRLGIGIVSSLLLGAAALVLGILAIRKAGQTASIPMDTFQPATFETVDPDDLDELLLEETESILELDDRLEAPMPESRVVRLFERQDPTPGELVDRIVGFLADGRRQEVEDTVIAEPVRHPDASAALQEALANIRASLR